MAPPVVGIDGSYFSFGFSFSSSCCRAPRKPRVADRRGACALCGSYLDFVVFVGHGVARSVAAPELGRVIVGSRAENMALIAYNTIASKRRVSCRVVCVSKYQRMPGHIPDGALVRVLNDALRRVQPVRIERKGEHVKK